MKNRTYHELIQIPTFKERFEYLKLDGNVGVATFGFERYLNQILYRSKNWKDIRNQIILRDNACDLAIPDREIYTQLIIHHMNPITIKDIEDGRPCIFDLENLISTSHNTHNAIHYGNIDLSANLPIERRKGDTCPWKAY